MRIAFAGGAAFGAAALEGLLASGQEIAGVVIATQAPEGLPLERAKGAAKGALAALPSLPAGFREAVGLLPLARRHGLRTLRLHRLGPPAAQDRLAALGVDLLLVASWGEILPESLLARFPWGAWNVHPSLLPEDRGADPAASALRRGARETGVTLHRMTAEIDRGDILWQRPLAITPGETAEDLRGRLALVAKEGVAEVFRDPGAALARARPCPPGGSYFRKPR